MNFRKIAIVCLGAVMLLGGCVSRTGKDSPDTGQEDITGAAASGMPDITAGLTKGAEGNPAEENNKLEENRDIGKDNAPEGDRNVGEGGIVGEDANARPNLPREWFLDRTLLYASQMTEDDFSVAEDFADSLLLQLSKESFAAAWEQAVRSLGELTGLEQGEIAFTGEANEKDGIIESFDGYLVATAFLWYEKQGITLSVTYNSACQIEGIYLSYLPLPEGVNPGNTADGASSPKETDDYIEVEVSIGDGEYQLDGILTLPKGVECPPVVLMVHGSGQSDWNETIGAAGNAPFADLAHGLAEQGIVTLRYNKRYFQYPQLATEEITIYDEVLDDVYDAIQLLEAIKEGEAADDIHADIAALEEQVGTGQMELGGTYVLGHSLGGMLAPYIAQENPQVTGIISLAGSPRKMWDIIYDQNMAAIELAELGEEGTEALMELIESEYQKVLAIARMVQEGEGFGFAEEGSSGLEEESVGLPMKENQNLETMEDGINLSEAIFGASGWYWASLAEINAGDIAQELEIPMLFLQGSADFQVYAEVDFAAWQQMLEGKENVEFVLFEGLNHLFMESDGSMSAAEYDIEAHVADAVVRKIADWVLEKETE